MKIWDYNCSQCGFSDELLVSNKEKDEQVCPGCGNLLERRISAVLVYVSSPERLNQMMRKRSKDHHERCMKKGIPLDDNNDSTRCTDPVWRNKTRAKCTDPNRIEKFRNIHKEFAKKPKVEIL